MRDLANGSRIVATILAVAFLASPFRSAQEAAPVAPPAEEPSQAFDLLLFLDWQNRLDEWPLFADEVGDPRGKDRFPEIGTEHEARRNRHDRRMLVQLAEIDPAQLNDTDRLDYGIFRRIVTTRVAEYDARSYLIPITSRSGFHVEFAKLPEKTRFEKVMDYRHYIGRMQAFRRYVAQNIETMREGIRSGHVLPAVVLEGWEDAVTTHIVDDPVDSRLYSPFVELPERFRPDLQDFLRRIAKEAIVEFVIPAYRDLEAFMRDEYLPAARKSIGASELPGGEAFYAGRVRRFTTLELTPDEVHATGLKEVARIRAEMLEVMRQVEFDGGLPEFLGFLRTDPRFYADTPEALLERTAAVLKKMDGQLPRFFGTLPRMPYGLREIPAYIAPKTTTAYYDPPAGDGSRAGFYNVNTYDLTSRPLYEVEALSLHEAVPGHHLQIALAQEMEGVRPFRRFADFTAFVEGWALYAERLGLEAGFYQDPYSDFGRLTYEMWRACRLVVDTGIHAKGWSRKQAIDYMAGNTALSLRNIENEVDRYISWPGQALGYKVGELRIRALRKRSEETLRGRFDLRGFHDAVLREGAVPLDLLEAQVDRWIDQVQRDAEDGP